MPKLGAFENPSKALGRRRIQRHSNIDLCSKCPEQCQRCPASHIHQKNGKGFTLRPQSSTHAPALCPAFLIKPAIRMSCYEYVDGKAALTGCLVNAEAAEKSNNTDFQRIHSCEFLFVDDPCKALQTLVGSHKHQNVARVYSNHAGGCCDPRRAPSCATLALTAPC